MKEIVGFVQWQWRRWELWQKLFIVGLSGIMSAVLLPNPYDTYMVLGVTGVTLVWTFKWAVWDNVQASWLKYREERNQLFKTIKDSDR